MESKFPVLHWGRILIAGITAAVLSIISLLLVIAAYAGFLALQTQGQPPDQAQIARFAAEIGPWVGPLFTMIAAIAAALWTAITLQKDMQLHGILVGLVTAIAALAATILFSQAIESAEIAGFFLTVMSGWLGGMLIRRDESVQKPQVKPGQQV